MPRTNLRFVAITTLHRLLQEQTPLPVLFDGLCREHALSAADRALAMNLVYGVLRHYQELERLMTALCRQPLKKLHPLAYQALAVGLFQLFFLERIPPSAAVNETVEGARAARLPSRLHGFINGVLRQSLRRRQELAGLLAADAACGGPLNHPDWLIAGWRERFGKETTEAICRCNNRRQPLCLRINRDRIAPADYLARLAEAGIRAEAGRFAPDALLLPDYSGSIAALPGREEGMFSVQGEAAQLCSLLLAPFHEGYRCLDACAGLGGKTNHLHRLLAPWEGSLTALEPEGHRYAKLAEALASRAHISIFQGDLQAFLGEAGNSFDGVLVDAPCSGTGVIGRQPDIRWRRTPADIRRYASRQGELLGLAARLVVPGGTLVYATCSLEEEENMAVVRGFLAAQPAFRLTDAAGLLPAAAAPLVRQNCLQPLPSDGLDGFFAARLVRTGGDD